MDKSSRAAGAILVATAVASIVLLLNHPAEHATDFVGMMREEAAAQAMNAIVHGGYIVVLAIQIACYSMLTSRLGGTRLLSTAAFVFFTVGAAAQMASLLTDGLIVPALAVKYLSPAPATLPLARDLFVLCETAIKFLMRWGLGFQAAAIAIWGAALLQVSRATGSLTLLLGLAMLAVIVAALFVAPILLMLAIPGVAIWALLAGVWMFRQTS